MTKIPNVETEEELHSKKGVPPKAHKKIEFQINLEDKDGNILDTDHRKTLEEAKNHFFTEEKYWSIEKTVDWWLEGSLVKRRHRLIEESS